MSENKIVLSLECRVRDVSWPLVHKLANGSANSLVQFSRIEREEEEIKDSGLRFTMWRIVTCAAARSVLRA